MLILFIYAEELFIFVFGTQWARAGQYAQWMCILPIFGLMRIPSLELAPILGKQATVLIFQIAQTALCTIALVIGGLYGDDILAIALFSIITALVNFSLVMRFWFFSLQHQTSWPGDKVNNVPKSEE